MASYTEPAGKISAPNTSGLPPTRAIMRGLTLAAGFVIYLLKSEGGKISEAPLEIQYHQKLDELNQPPSSQCKLTFRLGSHHCELDAEQFTIAGDFDQISMQPDRISLKRVRCVFCSVSGLNSAQDLG